MAARARRSPRERQLLARLTRRLELLADTLDAAPVADKGMDVVRELKEVHALLRALEDAPAAGGAPGAEAGRLVVVWADAAPAPGAE